MAATKGEESMTGGRNTAPGTAGGSFSTDDLRSLARRLDPPSRRRFLERTALGALGVGLLPRLGTAAPAAGRRRLIYLFMAGGMTHIDTFDVKPGSENQGPTTPIGTDVAGIQFGQYLPQLSRHFKELAVVRSMNTQTADHEQGEYLMRTSYEALATERHPSLGPWMQRFNGRANASMPDTVLIAAPARHPGAGFLDPSYTPLPIGDPSRGLENTKPPAYLTEGSLEKRLRLIESFDRAFRARYPLEQVRSYTDFYDEASSLLSSDELAAFDLEKEKDRERYGLNPFGQGCLLARRLIENNVQCVEVTLGGWDMHSTLWARGSLPERAGMLDVALSTLLADLRSSGLLDETVVVLTTEFGRSPQVNYNAGRDHHPAVFSAVLAGAGIATGQVYGSSDARAHAVADDGVTPADLNATIAVALGLPLDATVFSPTGRPFKVAHDGTPVAKLLS